MTTRVIAAALENLGYEAERATQLANEWTTENVVTIDGNQHDVLWYVEETEAGKELVYSLTEQRFLDIDEIANMEA